MKRQPPITSFSFQINNTDTQVNIIFTRLPCFKWKYDNSDKQPVPTNT